jgi:hypothetical protein
VVAVPMKLKKRMATDQRRNVAPMMMKIKELSTFLQANRPRKLEAINVISPAVNPVFNPFIAFSIFYSSLL